MKKIEELTKDEKMEAYRDHEIACAFSFSVMAGIFVGILMFLIPFASLPVALVVLSPRLIMTACRLTGIVGYQVPEDEWMEEWIEEKFGVDSTPKEESTS